MSPGRQVAVKRSRAALVPVAATVGLIALKLATGVLTGSLAVLASLVDSLMDLIASSVNYVAVRGADVPPDADHRWGHGKAESVSGLAQAFLVALSVAALVWQAVQRLLEPEPLRHVGAGIAVMVVSSIVAIGVAVFLRRAGRRYGSLALTADAAHYLSDGLTNSAAIVALVGYSVFDITWIDPLMSFAIAIVLGRTALGIGKQALDELMDRELADEVRREINETVVSTSSKIYGMHALKTRRSGRTLVVELHLELPHEMSFTEAHRLTADIEERLRAALGDCMVTIHPEPYVAPGEPLLAGDP